MKFFENSQFGAQGFPDPFLPSSPQASDAKMWWSTCCRQAPTCMHATTAASSRFTTPARSAILRWESLASVPLQITCISTRNYLICSSLEHFCHQSILHCTSDAVGGTESSLRLVENSMDTENSCKHASLDLISVSSIVRPFIHSSIHSYIHFLLNS